MTTREKAAFLRANGWKKRPNSEYWQGPGAFKGWFSLELLPKAFALASRRKAQRERAALKKAGWSPCNEKGWHSDRHLSGECMTRAEALKQLGIK